MCTPCPVAFEYDTMYYFIVLLAVTLTALADNTEEFKKCIEYLETPHRCCKSGQFVKNPIDDDIVKECMLIPYTPGSCERAMCYGTKKGIATDDGTIKMDVLKKELDDKLADQKDLLEAIKEKCLDDGYQMYGEDDDCDLAKLGNCLHWQLRFGCTDFLDDGPCEGSEELSKKCLALE